MKARRSLYNGGFNEYKTIPALGIEYVHDMLRAAELWIKDSLKDPPGRQYPNMFSGQLVTLVDVPKHHSLISINAIYPIIVDSTGNTRAYWPGNIAIIPLCLYYAKNVQIPIFLEYLGRYHREAEQIVTLTGSHHNTLEFTNLQAGVVVDCCRLANIRA